jgi:uncharacterized lipoprotein YmbA
MMLRREGGDRRKEGVLRASDTRQAARLTGCCAVPVFETSPRSLLERPVLAFTIALVFAACSVLAPKQDRTHFIMLAPTTPSSSSRTPLRASPKLASVAIGLGPVQLPQYLDRPELVIRTSPNGFELSQTDRWAEPLGDNFCQVLANDLTNLLGTANIVKYPWYPGTRLDFIVHIQLQRFEADTNNNAELIGRWELRTPQADQSLAASDAQISRPLSSPAGDAAARALSQDVAELAGQIASAVAQSEQQRLARGPR